MTRLNSQRENSWCVNNSWVNTICYCHHLKTFREMAPFRALDWNCLLSALRLNLERQVWRGRSLKRIGEREEGMGKKQGLWKRYREWERRVGSYTCPHVSQHIHTHSDTRCDVRELVISDFADFIISVSFLPSARDLCIHHILPALTWFLWFHICSSTDIQDVQFVLLNRLGPEGRWCWRTSIRFKEVSIRRSHGITMKVQGEKNFCKGYLHVAGGWWNPQSEAHLHEKICE